MPIILIWNDAAAQWERQFKRWLKELALYAGGIGSWLGKRIAEGKKIERATQGFPVFRFYNLALTARVDRSQFGALLVEPVATLGDHFRNIGEAWRVDREIGNRVREATLIGRTLEVIERLSAGTLASINRYATPNAAMFDPRGRSVWDLRGMAVLAFRAVVRGREGILDRATRVRNALRPPPAEGGDTQTTTTTGPAASMPAPLPLAMQLDEAVRYIGAALLILPATGALLIEMGRDVLLWVRHYVLDMFEGYERRVLDMRQALLVGIWTGLQMFSGVVTGLTAMATEHVIGLTRLWTRFGSAYIGGVLDGVSAFAGDFQTFWRGVHTMLQRAVNFADALMGIDLTEVVHQVLLTIQQTIEFINFHYYAVDESPTPYAPPGTPIQVTLGELALAEGGGVSARSQLGTALQRLDAARAGASGLNFNIALAQRFAVDMNLFGILQGTRELLPRLGVRPPGARRQPRLTYIPEGGPDLVTRIIAPLRAGVGDMYTRVGNRAQNGVDHIILGAVTLLDTATEGFHGAATRAAGLGSEAQWRRIVADADTLTNRVFPDAPAARPTGLERLGRTFGLWLRGNFNTIGAIVTGYLGFVLREWHQHLDANADTPFEVTETSPKKLLARAELGRVHMPMLRITVPERLPDAAVAAVVASRFRGEVQRAYATGQSRLAAAAR